MSSLIFGRNLETNKQGASAFSSTFLNPTTTCPPSCWNSSGFGFLLCRLGVTQVTIKTSGLQRSRPQRKASRARFWEVRDSGWGAQCSVLSDNNTQLQSSLPTRVRRAASICTVITSHHSDIWAAAQQHILPGPGGELELLFLFPARLLLFELMIEIWVLGNICSVIWGRGKTWV